MDYGRHVENVHVGIMEYVYEGVHFYFIDNEYYFKCDRPYSDSTQWDIERFIFFSKAVLAAMPVIGFHPYSSKAPLRPTAFIGEPRAS